MLEFEFPFAGTGTWSIAVTGDIYRATSLAGTGFPPQGGAQDSPLTIGMGIGPTGDASYVLDVTNALAAQDAATDPAFVATADVRVPGIGGPKSLYVFYNNLVATTTPYTVLIYKVHATAPVSLGGKVGAKRGYFS